MPTENGSLSRIASPASRENVMKWDRQSVAAAIPVAVVACIAAVISYGHIETLALSVHQPLAAARLLPFAVDFLIVAGSAILLAGYWLGWLCVISGVAATLFANVESGLPYGPLAATVAAWPAVAFTVASFVLERWLRRQAAVPAVPGAALAVPAVSNGHDPDVSAVLRDVPAGTVPSIRQVRSVLGCGQPRAKQVQDRIRVLAG